MYTGENTYRGGSKSLATIDNLAGYIHLYSDNCWRIFIRKRDLINRVSVHTGDVDTIRSETHSSSEAYEQDLCARRSSLWIDV
jgi:hypothetical protein